MRAKLGGRAKLIGVRLVPFVFLLVLGVPLAITSDAVAQSSSDQGSSNQSSSNQNSVTKESRMQSSYQELVTLFGEWRAFERPPLRDGAPDYTVATLARKREGLAKFEARLAAIDTKGWSVPEQIDWQIVRAEMNGLDFDLRVLKPWERDPAFYQSVWTEQSDTPAHEGPMHHAPVELWTYSFPLTADAERKLTAELRTIPPLVTQARLNLTGNAHDLWLAGTGTMQNQVAALASLDKTTVKGSADLRNAIKAAHTATTEFVAWLEREAPKKTGPSGVGKENYTWSLQNVHLVPMTWDDEVTLLKRELARAHASLRMEEARNRGLPPLHVSVNAEDYQRRGNEAVTKYLAFLKAKDLVAIEPFMDSAMRTHLGEFVPEATRNFFAIASHHEPLTLYTHFYHWFDHGYMREQPNASPIRREPLLFNIWDTRAEGMATAVEELTMHAGLYDDSPRAREVQWIMLAQRAARGLASLYAHANEFDLKQAKAFQVEWTPRGWMRPDLDLLGFEQQLYLRQPGYGTSYITGKYLIEQVLEERSHQLGKDFTSRRFFAEFNGAGLIPVSLIRWQLTGTRLQFESQH
jgi:uncharacterized protein (DUF885 family)